mgnify:CR=1 FL=1
MKVSFSKSRSRYRAKILNKLPYKKTHLRCSDLCKPRLLQPMSKSLYFKCRFVSKLKIAVAQVPSQRGDVSCNIDIHIGAVNKAATLGISYIVFPELSLTGYEADLSKALAFSKNDVRIRPLVNAAMEHQIYIVAGAPLETDELPRIGAFIISPTGDVCTYEKMHLHPGEEKFYSAGHSYQLTQIDDEIIANAICADTNAQGHARACASLGATIYIAGVLITPDGYVSDTDKLKSYARKYGMIVAMANHSRPTGGWQPCGRSAIWATNGLLACAGESNSALVMAQMKPSGWVGEVVEI